MARLAGRSTDLWRIGSRAGALLLAIIAVLALTSTESRADDLPVSADSEDDDNFGPLITIEAIEITGNEATSSAVILDALPIAAGEVLRADSIKLEQARYRILALGFFRSVELRLARGLERGQVVEHLPILASGGRVARNERIETQAAASTSCATRASRAPMNRWTAASSCSGSPSTAGSSTTMPSTTTAPAMVAE